MKKLEHMTEPELQEFMRLLAGSLEFIAHEEGIEKPHFVLLLFNDPKVAQYVANCRREDIIAALKEAAGRLERKEDVERGRGS